MGRRGIDWFVLSGGLAAFGTYFCMYAFRKPFTAVTFEGAGPLVGLDFKVALVVAQLIGYALSKVIGVRVISELRPRGRATLLVGLIAVAELALVGLWLVGDHWSAVFMLFLNGLPLGLIWGIVFSYLEGRRVTELLGTMLAVSFIVSSGVVKSVGAAVAQVSGISEYAMPAVVGGLFFPFLLLFAWWLSRLPPPDRRDVAARTLRQPLDARGRRELFKQLGPGILGILLYYVLITVIRDVRDSFAPELWSGVGHVSTPEIFAVAEMPIAVIALLVMAAGYFIRSNRLALRYYHLLIVVSSLLVLTSTTAYSIGLIGGTAWLITVGLGLYVGYVPLNAVYFDRLVATFRQAATAGFLIYVADAGGYLGSVSVMLYKSYGGGTESWLVFFIKLCYLAGGLGLALSGFGWYQLERRMRRIKKGKSNSLKIWQNMNRNQLPIENLNKT